MCLNSLESSALQISLWAKCEAEFISQIESSAWQIFIIFIGFYFHSCLQTQEEVWRLMVSWLMVCSAEGRGRSKEQPNLNTEDCASMWDWCEFHVLLTDILQPKATDEGSERLPFDLFRTQPLFLSPAFPPSPSLSVSPSLCSYTFIYGTHSTTVHFPEHSLLFLIASSFKCNSCYQPSTLLSAPSHHSVCGQQGPAIESYQSHTHTHPWSDCALSPTSSHVVKPQSSYILNRLSVFSSRFSRDSIYINISIQYDTEKMNKVTERCIGSDVRCYNMTHLSRQCTAWQLTYTQTHTHDLSCQKWP